MWDFDIEVHEDELEDLIQEIIAEVNETVHDTGDEIFAESQNNVPVLNAILKDSGSVIHGDLYSLVGYNTPYAAVVHDGFDGVQEVQEHMRRSVKGNAHRVRAHYRYVDRIGRPYLDDAIDVVLRELAGKNPDIADLISVTRIGKDVDIG